MTTTNEGTQRDELAEIKARLSAAVPGPWSLSLDFQRKWMLLLAGSGTADEYRIAKLADDDTAEFIAHSPADIAKLIAALEAILYACTQVDMESNEPQQDWLVGAIHTICEEILA